MFNIVERLDKDIFEPYIVVQQKGGKVYDEAIEKGYTILNLPFSVSGSKGILNKVITAYKLAQKFKQYRFNIWQSFGWSSDFTEPLIAKFSGAKFIYVKKNMNWGRRAWKVKSFLADAIIARNTTLLKTHLSARRYKRKTTFITGGVDTEKYFPTYGGDLRASLAIPTNAILVSCVAQLVRLKNQHTLIEAIEPLKDVYLLLAGAEKDSDYAKELKMLVSRLGLNKRVIFAGTIADINSLLNSSDIFVLPTSSLGGHEEGCPVALLEAMAAGVPAIGGNVAGNRDLIIPGETGLLFEPQNVDALTAAINVYINDAGFAKQMAASARKKILLSHTLEKEARAFSDLYKHIHSR